MTTEINNTLSKVDSLNNNIRPVILPQKLTIPVIDIVIPCYKDHLEHIRSLLISFNMNCIDKEYTLINIIISRDELTLFEDEILKKFSLNIKLSVFSDLIKKYEGKTVSENELLEKIGKFNFQSIKKLYGMLDASSEYVCVFDSESLFIRKISMYEYVKCNKHIYYYSSRLQPHMTNHARHMQTEMNKLLENDNTLVNFNGSNNLWFLEAYLWIFNKHVLIDIVMQMKIKFGSMTNITSEFFIEYCYYLFYFTNQSKYPVVQWIDTLNVIKNNLPAHDYNYWMQNTPEWSVIEHCTTQIKSPTSIIAVTKIFQDLNLPVCRVVENSFDIALFLSFTKNIKICVSNHCNIVYKLVKKDFFNKNIKIFMSGLIRANDNINTIKNTIDPLTHDILKCDIYTYLTFENNNSANLFKTLINPKYMIADNTLQEDTTHIRYPYYVYNARSINNMYQMFYKKRKLMDLIDINTNDYIIYMRPDIESLDNIKVIDIIKGMLHDMTIRDNTNTIYIPNLYNSVGVTDMFAIGNSTVIRKYLSIFDYYKECLNKYICNPEFVTYKMICKLGINIRFFDWNFKVCWHDKNAINTWWRNDKYGINNKYTEEELSIKMNSFETLYHHFSTSTSFILTHKKTGLNIYVDNENITLDTRKYSTFFIKHTDTFTRANIKLETNKPNLNNDGTGWNLFTLPKDNKLYGKGNDKIWAQFYIVREGLYYHIVTSHKELNSPGAFGRYVGIILTEDNVNTICTNMPKSEDTEWIINKPGKHKQMKVFASGSCRILTSLSKINNNNIRCVHTMNKNFIGTNFMGKLHTIKQHLQFIRYLRNELHMSQKDLSYFLTTFNKTRLPECPRNNPLHSKIALTNELNSCDVFIFEISSIKDFIYEKTNHINIEFLDKSINYETKIMSYEEIVNDIVILSQYIKKPIIFLCNFRPQIYGKQNTPVPNREIIYNACKDGAKKTGNYFYDPSEIIKAHGSNNVMVDDNHLNDRGHEIHAAYIEKLLNNIIN
jgi:hypothetical protein